MASPSMAPRRIIGDWFAGLAPLTGITAATWWVLDLADSYLALSLALYVGLGLLILQAKPEAVEGSGLGHANRVTLGRSVLALPVSATALYAPFSRPADYWWIILLASVALALDGVDGKVARSTGTETRFGARFDMEMDAFFILALSVLVWRSGRVGPWVLLVGAMRYLFVAAGWVIPALRRELPESTRRKVVCVVQGVGLLVCVGPIIPGWMAVAVAAGAVVLLAWSFAVDARWLLARGGSSP